MNNNKPIMSQSIPVDLNTLQTVLCSCGKAFFESVIMYKILPAIYSSTGKPNVVGIQAIQCVDCKSIFMLEDVLKSANEPNIEPSRIVS